MYFSFLLILPAHTAKVTDLYYDHAKSILISCGKDKYISWHGSKNGQRFSGFQTLAVPVCIQLELLLFYIYFEESFVSTFRLNFKYF